MYYTMIKHSSHLRTLKKCRKHSPAAHVLYISLVFSNDHHVLSQCHTQLRLLHLLSKGSHIFTRCKLYKRNCHTFSVVKNFFMSIIATHGRIKHTCIQSIMFKLKFHLFIMMYMKFLAQFISG